MSKEMDAVSLLEASLATFASYASNSVRASWTAASSSTGLDGVAASDGDGGRRAAVGLEAVVRAAARATAEGPGGR